MAAGSASDAVTGVAALAPDSSAIDYVANISPRRLLLLHGGADHVVPAALSRLLYGHAEDPKELVIYPGERHDFTVYREEALDKLTTWTRTLLRSPFKPRLLRRDAASVGLLDSIPHTSDAGLTAPSLN